MFLSLSQVANEHGLAMVTLGTGRHHRPINGPTGRVPRALSVHVIVQSYDRDVRSVRLL